MDENPTQPFATPDGSRPVPPPPAPPAAPASAAPASGAPSAGSAPSTGAGYGHPYASYAPGSAFAAQPHQTQPHQTQPHQAQPHQGQPRPADRPRRTWPAVVSTAAVTALLVGGGSAFATSALLRDDASGPAASTVDGLGRTSTISVDSVAPASWEEVAARVAPTVVAIDVTTRSSESQGSGVIIDTAGHVLTNNHVVTGATDDTVTVTLSDGRLYDAKIVGLDPSTDLAVVKIVDPPSDLVAATLADSSAVVVGNAVMAVGNPLGLAHTVTTGIVSAVERPVTTTGDGSTVVTNAIQIDAAVNPGNSGGPLFDAAGEVIGITSSIASLSSGSDQAGSIGLGFAIPSNLARSVGDQLIATGSAEHAFLGVSLTDATATADGVTRRGARVEQVTQGSPAATGGILAGDVVVAIDGAAVNGAEYLTAAVRERVEGDRAVLTVVRDGAAQEVTVTLAARTEEATQQPEEEGSDEGRGWPDRGDGSEEGRLPGGMTQDDFFRWLQENM